MATNLAGAVPLNLQPLSSNEEVDMNIDLFNKLHDNDNTGPENHYRPDIKSNVYSSEILVSTKGSRIIEYDMEGVKFEDTCSTICFNCVYDLLISFTDECGNELIGENPIIETLGTQSIDCSDIVATYNSGQMVTNNPLPVGNYSLNKKLSLNENAIDAYTRAFLLADVTPGCRLTYQDFLSLYMDSLDFSGCETSCEECIASLGGDDWSESPRNPAFNSECNPCLTEQEFNLYVKNCKEPCDEGNIDCRSKYDAMLLDVSLSGQYGGAFVSQTGSSFPQDPDDLTTSSFAPQTSVLIQPENYPLSVFNEDNHLPIKAKYISNNTSLWSDIFPDWKHPFVPKFELPAFANTYDPNNDVPDTSQFHYFEDNGKISYVELERLGTTNFTYYPQITDVNEVHEDVEGNFYIEPQYLADVKDFIANWRESWGKSLLQYHPEICYYEFCLFTENVNEFDYYWNNTLLWEDIIKEPGLAAASFNPVGTTDENAIDPFFSDNFYFHHNSEFVDQNQLQINEDMRAKMENYAIIPGTNNPVEYFSIWEMAYIITKCNSTTCAFEYQQCLDDFNTPCSANSYCTFLDGSSVPCAWDYNFCLWDDAVWGTFRAMYFSLKQQYLHQRMIEYAIKHECYNGCMNTDNFDIHNNDFFETPYPYFGDGENSMLNFPNIGPFYDFSFLQSWCNNTLADENSQYYNLAQPCNSETNAYYADKIMRFPSADNIMQQAINIDNLCWDSENNVLIPCSQEEAIIEQGVTYAQNSIMNTCGQCPLAKDLQIFLNALANKNDFGEVGLPLNCLPNNYPEFVPDLDVAVPGSGEATWSYIETITHQEPVTLNDINVIHGKINREDASDSGSCDFWLQLPTGHTIADISITYICCLEESINPNYVPNNEGKVFTVDMIYTYIDGEGDTITVEANDLEGSTSCISIGECTLSPVCQPSVQAKQMLNLFNALLVNNYTITDPDHSDFTDSDINLTVHYNSLMIPLITQYFDINPSGDNDWEWDVAFTLDNSFMEVTIHDDIPENNCVIQFEFVNNVIVDGVPNYKFENIMMFMNIGPDQSSPLNDNDFYISAKYNNGGNIEYIPIRGSFSCFSAGECSNNISGY